ncbi:hypothetical protein AALP_AA3G224700 [Arabis alpina]|uniref:RING-type domain-containing protein n=1 Tax=Arabis alpina TaxID=50452 RepID=A0A087HAY3_ARAAL|nr:hypothetical protein AALP_AA3G224700 [Arabis alpina]
MTSPSDCRKSQLGRSHSDLRSDPSLNQASINGNLRNRREPRLRQLRHRVGFSSNAQCLSETQCKSKWGSYSFSESLERDRLCNRLKGMSLTCNRRSNKVSARDLRIFHRKIPFFLECNKNPQALDVTNSLHTPEVSSPEVNSESRECGDTETPECCIFCLESLANGDTLVMLNCSHIYHSDCLDPWLEIHGDCPYCRRLVINELEEEPKPILNRSLSWFETLLVFMGFAVTY